MAQMPTLEVWVGQELPDTTFDWYATPTTLVDLSAAHTYQLTVAPISNTAATTFVKTTGFTGAATSPNLTISWSTAGELNLLTAGTVYLAQLRARRTSDSKDRYMEFRIVAKEVI